MFVFILDVAPPPIVAPAHICDYPGFDLDGDGVSEDFQEVRDSRGTGGAVYDVYLGNRKIGQVAGCWWRLGDKSHHGLRDLVGIWRLGCCERQPTYYVFDGRSYRARTGKPRRSE
jgi:hypothetical protein